MATRLEGTVKWFNNKKGYGFIIRPEHPDVFVHHRGIRGTGYKTLEEGELVSYILENNEKGPRACEVRLESRRVA